MNAMHLFLGVVRVVVVESRPHQPLLGLSQQLGVTQEEVFRPELLLLGQRYQNLHFVFGRQQTLNLGLADSKCA